jgi:hypothetical protein
MQRWCIEVAIMSRSTHSAVHAPVRLTDTPEPDDTPLDRQWELATLEVMNAQRAYAELEGRIGANDSVVAAAWLRLWRAEERQRQLASRVDESPEP